jgi:hypothetical protein
VKKDSGLIYIAQNAARHPESPLEPLFRALYLTHPDFDIRSVDVISDRNNIRKLLSFINPSSRKNGLEPFTMNIEISKDTAIFKREETKTQDYIGPHDFRGYGHEFEKAYTTSQIPGSTGHHRIISYRFGGMSFIIRHEVDGYVKANTTTSPAGGDDAGNNTLSSAFKSMSLSQTTDRPENSHPRSKLTVKEEGQLVPLETTLKIKTRVFHKQISIEEVSPQLWISQTPKLVRAYHQRGVFQQAEVTETGSQIKMWENDHQEDLKKLAALIREIVAKVKECGGRATLRYDDAVDKLVIQKSDGNKMLPEDLYLKWDNMADSDENPKKDGRAEDDGPGCSVGGVEA